jgi:hypothetical protein
LISDERFSNGHSCLSSIVFIEEFVDKINDEIKLVKKLSSINSQPSKIKLSKEFIQRKL